MIKVHATYQKKVPVPNLEFSSQSYGASVEAEVENPAQVEQKLHNIYALLEKAVNAELEKNAKGRSSPYSNRKGGDNGNGGNGSRTSARATRAQVRAIFAIGKSQGQTNQQIQSLAEGFGVKKLDDLSLQQASNLIEKLNEGG